MRTIQIKDKNGLSIGTKSATIKLEWDPNSNHELQLKALAILLGDYNKHGRKIDLQTHRERIRRFGDLLEEIVEDIC